MFNTPSLIFVFVCFYLSVCVIHNAPFVSAFNMLEYPNGYLEKKYGRISENERIRLREVAREMFNFGYNSYLKYAYPYDELDPIHCQGRGPDYENPSNININDALGDYSLTLIDALDALAIFGYEEKFKNAVQLVIENVTFDKDTTIQVFEANIRVIGALLSAHLLIRDKRQHFGKLEPDWYAGELLEMASDLATRLLPAFENSKTGLPHPRVHLRMGVPENGRTDTCTAGAGTLMVEFGILSRLLGDPIYELAAKRANRVLWQLRHQETGLFGNVVDVNTGNWEGELSGLGAGLDSFFEYMLKAYILFGNVEDYAMFNESYNLIKQYMRKGRSNCNSGHGSHPLYVNVHMKNGGTHTTWIDSLQAAFAGIQVLAGDIEEAICTHALYYVIWKKYGVLPERYNWQQKVPDISFYPLRPEFAESTYLLYQATKNPFYLHVGREIMDSLNNLTRVECGFATVHSVFDKSLEDRMESFFLSETCKYLYLLFDKENPVNVHPNHYVFTTEGHVIPTGPWLRKQEWDDRFPSSFTVAPVNVSNANCQPIDDERKFGLPLQSRYLAQVSSYVGVEL